MTTTAPKLIDLYEKATSEDLKEPDIGINLEIADRINSRRRYCLEGIEYFKQLFKSTDLKTIDLTLTLFETCVKNCNIHFHRYINSRDLMPSILQLLKRKRKKLNLVEKLAGLYKNAGWRKIEDRVLALVQLWADTFMMQEDAYPVFMRAYRELRQENIKFPARDPNERFMIKFEGEPSPAFELADIEQANISSHSASNSKSNSRIEDSKNRSQQEEVPKLLESDVQSIKESFESLAEILCNARDVRELQEPRAKDIIRKCRAGQKKLMWVVSYKTETADESSVVELIGIMEYINTRMENFKKAAGILKRGGKSEEIKELLQDKKVSKKQEAPVDLLDMGEDFLEVDDVSPLDSLYKFVQGKEPVKNEKVEFVRKEVVREEVKEEAKVPVKNDQHRRLEQPDLLFDEVEPTPQPNIFDLNTLQIGTPNYGNPSYPQNPGFNPAYPSQGFNPGYGAPVYGQNFPNPGPNYGQNYNPYPANVPQPVQFKDDFEDFFSDLANRKAV